MSQLNFSVRDSGEVSVIELFGPLAIGDFKLQGTVRRLLEQGRMKLVLDMSSVPFVDSTGIGELVVAYSAARRRGGTLKLVGLSNKVKETLDMVRLIDGFETFDDCQTAIETFQRGPSN